MQKNQFLQRNPTGPILMTQEPGLNMRGGRWVEARAGQDPTF